MLKKIIIIFQISLFFIISCTKDTPITVQSNNPPSIPLLIYPTNNSTIDTLNVPLMWSSSDNDNDKLKFDLYFGSSSTVSLLESNLSKSNFTINNLRLNKKYFWQICAKDGKDTILSTISTFNTPNVPIRFNGLYVYPNGYNILLKFYDDGQVIETQTTGSPVEVTSWFVITNSTLAKGYFKVNNSTLSFSVIDQYGTIDYWGNIKNDSLFLESYSHINGNKSSRIFSFLPIN